LDPIRRVVVRGTLVLLGSAWASVVPAREITGQKDAPSADDSPTELKIGLVFPAETQDGKPLLTAAIMVNGRTVLPAGTRLYTIYQMPHAEDQDMRQAQKKVDRGQAFSRSQGVAIQEKRSAAAIALEERAFKTRWNSDLPFRAMLNLHAGRDLFLVVAGQGGAPEIHPFNLPEGLLLWDKGQGPEVGWVLEDSSSQGAGFKRGDRIVSVGGKAVPTLADFQREYAASKTTQLGDRGLKIEVKPAAGGETATRELRAPASLMGSFLDIPME